MKKLVRVNERGIRIGESHPNARLSDVEVELLRCDRDAGLSLSALASKYGLSKSGAKKIVDGVCRGQIGPTVHAAETRRAKIKKVSVQISLPLNLRAKVHRLGGSAWVEKMVKEAKEPPKRVLTARMELNLPPHISAKLHRMGFSKWLKEIVAAHDHVPR